MVNTFRNYYRENATTKAIATHGAFSASFQGKKMDGTKEEEDARKKSKKKDCLCGDMHRFKECLYIMKSAQNWTPDKAVQA